jgi:hypothetical protein
VCPHQILVPLTTEMVPHQTVQTGILSNRSLQEKAETKLFVENKDTLRAAMKAEKVRFEQPRF